MESFGNILREKRDELELPLEKIERETSISKEYLLAIEEERVDIFPGETYFIGFMRNYADYLGEDAERLLTLYRAKKIQLSPTPEGLIVSDEKKKRLVWIIIGAVAVVIFAVAAFFLFGPKKETEVAQVLLNSDVTNQTYKIDGTPFQKRIYKGDVIQIQDNDKTLDLLVQSTEDTLSLDTPIGLQIVELGEENEFVLNPKTKLSLVIYVLDISRSGDNRGAEVRMFVRNSAAAQEQAPSVVVDVMEPQDKSLDQKSVILEDVRAYPFTLNISFRGATLFRHKNDKQEAIERYYNTSDTLVFQSNNATRLWMSNSNSVKIQIIADGKTYDLDIGRPGQVLVNEIRWIKDFDGKYKLVVEEID